MARTTRTELRLRRNAHNRKRRGSTAIAFVLAFAMLAGTAFANHNPPDVEITSPADGAVLAAGTTNVTIAGTVEGQARVRVTVKVGANEPVQQYDTGENINGPWSFNLAGLVNGETYEVVASASHGTTTNPGIDTITFSVATPVTQKTSPDTKEDCDNGGWSEFLFKNHGQCVRYVANGKDSR